MGLKDLWIMHLLIVLQFLENWVSKRAVHTNETDAYTREMWFKVLHFKVQMLKLMTIPFQQLINEFLIAVYSNELQWLVLDKSTILSKFDNEIYGGT